MRTFVDQIRISIVLALAVVLARCAGPTPAPAPKPAVDEIVPAPPAAPARVTAPLPKDAFRVAWGRQSIPRRMAASSRVKISIVVLNASPHTWPDPGMADPNLFGAFAVRLSYRWLGEDGVPVSDFRDRVDLPAPLLPGKAVNLELDVEAPGKPGKYRLLIDLCQEMHDWFGARGGRPNITDVEVVETYGPRREE